VAIRAGASRFGRRAPRGGPARPAPRKKKFLPAPKVRREPGRPLHVEIVAVGRELVRGQTADADAAHVASSLSERGAIVHRITFVDDNERAIGEAIQEAFGRGAGLVVTTGGLGPALEDRTLEGIARASGHPLSAHARARAMVEAAYARLRARGRVSLPGTNRAREKMCAIPVGSEPIENRIGVAPGVLLRLAGGGAILALPGAPEEARAVLEAALTRLRDLLPRLVVASREIESPTEDESALRPLLDRIAAEHPRVSVQSLAAGFAHEGQPVRIRLEASARTRKEADAMLDAAVRRLLSLAGSGALP